MRHAIITPKAGRSQMKTSRRPVKASTSNSKLRAKQDLYNKIHAAFDAVENYYDLLKDEYRGELDDIYEGLELLTRELENDINY